MRILNALIRALRKALKLLRLPEVSLLSDRMTVKPIVGIFLGVIILSVLIIGLSGALNMSAALHSKGKVRAIGVGIYQDSVCDVPVGELNWGTLEPGSTQYIEAYVRNEGNVPIRLSLYTVDWSPSNASSYIEFGWDYDNSVIDAREDNVLKVTFYLCVSSDIQGLTEFTFDVIIDATKA